LFEYSKEDYYSKVNDFGDDYHKAEEELSTGFDKELMTKVRTLKRKYRDFEEFYDAKEVYNQYADYLIEKYGGKKRFKFLYQIGMVKEYIPFCPELRNIKKNRPYIKQGLPLVPEYEASWGPKVLTEEEWEELYKVGINFKLGKSKYSMKLRDEKRIRTSIESSVADDLNLISSYYSGRIKDPTALSHKSRRRKIMEERYKNNTYVPVAKRYAEYQERHWRYDYDEDRIDPDAYVFYKDVSLSIEEAQECELYDWLEQHGIKTRKRRLSKAARKVVRKTSTLKIKGKKKKKKKKGKNIMRTKFMDKFSKSGYNTFGDFAKEMQSLALEQIRG
jgi:hypothetical protein